MMLDFIPLNKSDSIINVIFIIFSVFVKWLNGILNLFKSSIDVAESID